MLEHKQNITVFPLYAIVCVHSLNAGLAYIPGRPAVFWRETEGEWIRERGEVWGETVFCRGCEKSFLLDTVVAVVLIIVKPW